MKKTEQGRIRERLTALLRSRWSPLALLLAGVLLLGVGYWIRPVQEQELILLTHQSSTLPAGGMLRVTGDVLRLDGREITGIREGSAQVRIDRLMEIEQYQVSVYVPEERGSLEQRVGVDAFIALGSGNRAYPVDWRSSDPEVASVENGVVTGVTTGTATITETLNDHLVYTYEVTVVQPRVERERLTVYPGEQVPVKVLYYTRKVNWSASNDVVRVNGDGSVTALRPGKTLLTAEIGDELLFCEVQVARPPSMARALTLRTDETEQLFLFNALGEVRYASGDESVVRVDELGRLTPVKAGTAEVTARCRDRKFTAQVTVKLTPEEEFRANNYGPYQPVTSVAALDMLGMCEYYNDTMKASRDRWYDTNLTKFAAPDTFQQALRARRKGANCNSLLNWSWHDMGIKHGSSTLLYGERESGDVHGYNGSNTSLRSLVDQCCTVTNTHREKTKSLEKRGQLRPGDMLFMVTHTFIYRGEGTVIASAGDSKFYRSGSNRIFKDWINGSSSYDWTRSITYKIRFQDDYIPPKYRNKAGEVVDNPMYLARQQGESPWTGKLSPTQREEQKLEPVTFFLGEEAEEARSAAPAQEQGLEEDSESEQEQGLTEDAGSEQEDSAGKDAAQSGTAPAQGREQTDSAPAGADEPEGEDIFAVVPAAPQEDVPPRMAGGKPYGSWPSTGKKKKASSSKTKKKTGSEPANSTTKR